MNLLKKTQDATTPEKYAYAMMPTSEAERLSKAREISDRVYEWLAQSSHYRFEFERQCLEVESKDGKWKSYELGPNATIQLKLMIPTKEQESEGE